MKAFPSSVSNGMGYVDNQQGMDLRDYFAAQVISALIQHSGYATAAKFSYQLADEMMKARMQ